MKQRKDEARDSVKRAMEQSVIIKFREGEIINNWALGLLEQQHAPLRLAHSFPLLWFNSPHVASSLFFPRLACLAAWTIADRRRVFSAVARRKKQKNDDDQHIIVTCFMCWFRLQRVIAVQHETWPSSSSLKYSSDNPPTVYCAKKTA